MNNILSPSLQRNACIEMSHGAGGSASQQLFEQLFLKHFDNPQLQLRNDQALVPGCGERLVISTDAHVISPLFFPGGDIGSLAVHGTINDIAMSGAQPLCMSAAFIIEEGFALADLERIVISMAAAARACETPIVTGDTKVVERGKGDGVFITTTGVGKVAAGLNFSAERALPGDVIILSGSLGDHGVAVMANREQLPLNTTILSDSAPLHGMVAEMIACAGADIRCLRDPTRGGLAATLNEWAQQSQVGLLIHEADIPVKPDVKAVCEILGLDPLYIANEGKLACICAPAAADALLQTLRRHPLGRDASIIGQAHTDSYRHVQMQTLFGGRRLVDMPLGELLPRIC